MAKGFFGKIAEKLDDGVDTISKVDFKNKISDGIGSATDYFDLSKNGDPKAEMTNAIDDIKHFQSLITNKNPAIKPKRSTNGTELSLEHLVWMCHHCLEEQNTFSVAKINRWIGFIQAGLVNHTITTVHAERERTRDREKQKETENGVSKKESRATQTG